MSACIKQCVDQL